MNKKSFSLVVVIFSQSLCYSTDINNIFNGNENSSDIVGRVINLEEYKPIRQEVRGYYHALNINHKEITEKIESVCDNFCIDATIKFLNDFSNNFLDNLYKSMEECNYEPKRLLELAVKQSFPDQINKAVLDIIVPFADKWEDYRPAKFRNNKVKLNF